METMSETPEISPKTLATMSAEDTQGALALQPGELTAEASGRRRQRRHRRDGLRSDARRTAEYIAARGKTPFEVWHDIVKLGWIEGPRFIIEQTGMSRRDAWEFYLSVSRDLAPYCGPRWEAIDPGAIASAGAAGSLATLHYLAARAAGDRILDARTESPIGQIVDSGNSQSLASTSDAVTGGVRQSPVVTMPPRGAD